jgi:hypothetical protein
MSSANGLTSKITTKAGHTITINDKEGEESIVIVHKNNSAIAMETNSKNESRITIHADQIYIDGQETIINGGNYYPLLVGTPGKSYSIGGQQFKSATKTKIG